MASRRERQEQRADLGIQLTASEVRLSDMAVGAIKKLFIDKHCGFIAGTAGGPDVFFHGTVVAGNEFRSLATGQRVEYELDREGEADGRGPRASRVRPLRTAPPAAAPQQGEFRQLRRHSAARAKKPTWRKKPDGSGDV